MRKLPKSISVMVCQGRWPVPACRAVLTAEEREWFGSTCAECESEWRLRLQSWHSGTADELFDDAYSRPSSRRRRAS